MTARPLSRRLALLLPVILAACGGPVEEPLTNFQPLRYDYLPPIGLNAATLEIRQQFYPSGARPDVTAQDPVPPIAALKAMAQDRLKTYGDSNRAVFSILDASLTQRGETIDGSMMVTLTLLTPDGRQLGLARAQVTKRHVASGNTGLRRTLYDFTSAMMDQMNVEFEYQIRHSLKSYLMEPSAPAAPVEQTPLDGRQAPPLTPSPGAPPSLPTGTLRPPPGAVPVGSSQPTVLAPPSGAPVLGPVQADPFAVPPSDPFTPSYPAR